MFNSMIFRCPFLRGSNEGARCDALLSNHEKNLIREMDDVNIKLCINTKRRFEVCHIYSNYLRDTANNKNTVEIESLKTQFIPPFVACKM